MGHPAARESPAQEVRQSRSKTRSTHLIRILAVCLMWVASGAWAGNLLINPGFESGSLAGWTVTGAPSGVDVACALT